MKTIEPYLKFVAQILVTIVAAIIAGLADDRLSAQEWSNVVILGLGAVAVLGAGNLPDGIWRYTKVIVSAATAAAVAAHTLLADGADLGTSQWLQISVAALGALGVYAVKGPEVVPAPYRRGKHEAGI